MVVGNGEAINPSIPCLGGVLASYRSERQISIKMSSFHIFYGRHEASTLRKVIITANTFANRVPDEARNTHLGRGRKVGAWRRDGPEKGWGSGAWECSCPEQ